MPKFSAGVVRLTNEVFPEKPVLFERLAPGQSPGALFLCAVCQAWGVKTR